MRVTREALAPEIIQRRWDLVMPHREELLAIARRRVDGYADAEDVVATALLRTVEHPGLDESRVGPFLCTTVMRLCVDVHRQRTRQLAVGVREATRTVEPVSPEESICDADEARWLAQELSSCPPRERQVLEARLAGLTPQQVSAQLGLSMKATENAYTRVRRRAQTLVSATLAGLGILFGLGRQARPGAVMAVPVATVGVVVLAVLTQLPVAEAPAEARPPMPAELSAERSLPAAALPEASPKVGTFSSRAHQAQPAPAATSAAVVPPRLTRSAKPTPARREVRTPAVVSRDVADPGGVFVEKRHEEPFDVSLRRCLTGLDPAGLVADPCRD